MNFLNNKILRFLGILILLAAIPLTVIISQKQQDTRQHAAELTDIDQLTNQLLLENTQYHQLAPRFQSQTEQTTPTPNSQLQQMVETAKTREQKLLTQIDSNPQDFLSHATLADQRGNFPKEVTDHIEERIDESGKYKLLHIDTKDKKAQNLPYFKPDSKAIPLKLTFPQAIINPSPESPAAVSGIALDQRLVVSSIHANPQKSLSPHLVTTNSMKLLIILVAFQDTVNSEITKAALTPRLDMLSRFYNENSYGHFALDPSSQIVGPFTLPYASTDDQASSNAGLDSADLVDSMVTSSGIDLSSYTNKYYVFETPIPALNFYAGWAFIGSDQAFDNAYDNDNVFVHELGHDLGLNHASSFDCPGNVFGPPDSCVLSEYGDIYDPMGSPSPYGTTNDFNAPHREALGWLDNLETVTASGTYHIAPLEDPTSAIHGLRIPTTFLGPFLINNNESFYSYYIEYRKPQGFDSAVPNGTMVHLWDEIDWRQTKIVDTNLATPGDASDAYLSDGQSFTDPINNITIQQVSHDSTGATIRISISAPITQTPTPTKLPADVDGDGCIGINDFSLWFQAIRAGQNSGPADINNDGKIDLVDFNAWFIAIRSGDHTCN